MLLRQIIIKQTWCLKLGSSEVATEKMRLTHEGDLNLITDSKSINFGADSEVSLTHVHNTGLLLNSTRGIFFDDASNLDQFIRSGGSDVLQQRLLQR